MIYSLEIRNFDIIKMTRHNLKYSMLRHKQIPRCKIRFKIAIDAYALMQRYNVFHKYTNIFPSQYTRCSSKILSYFTIDQNVKKIILRYSLTLLCSIYLML